MLYNSMFLKVVSLFFIVITLICHYKFNMFMRIVKKRRNERLLDYSLSEENPNG